MARELKDPEPSRRRLGMGLRERLAGLDLGPAPDLPREPKYRSGGSSTSIAE